MMDLEELRSLRTQIRLKSYVLARAAFNEAKAAIARLDANLALGDRGELEQIYKELKKKMNLQSGRKRSADE